MGNLKGLLAFRHGLIVLWVLAAVGVGIFAYLQPPLESPLWDMDVYRKAIACVHRGGDPYAEGIARQQAFHNQTVRDANHPPMTYVYSPLTLCCLRVLGCIPEWFLGTLYLLALVGGYLASVWAGWQMARPEEKRILALLLPMTIFFPGLLTDNVYLSGNVAYILFGMMLAASVREWKHGRWGWFYVAVLVASLCKAPLLSMLAFPVIVCRRQWGPAILSGAIGLSLFLFQPLLWPVYFAEYLHAVKLQFDWNLDFGISPAGVLGRFLADYGDPCSSATTWFYLCFALLLGGTLLWLGYQVRENAEAWHSFLPVALMGTMLLNPRVKEYDIAALTVPMMLIVWRQLKALVQHWKVSHPRLLLVALVCLLEAGVNLLSVEIPGEWWKPCQMNLLLLVLATGILRCTFRRQEGWMEASVSEAI